MDVVEENEDPLADAMDLDLTDLGKFWKFQHLISQND